MDQMDLMEQKCWEKLSQPQPLEFESKSLVPYNTVKQQQKRPVTVTEIFTRNKESRAKIVANRGGRRSSKSYSLAQLLLERFFTLPNRKILILRKTAPSLRTTTLKLVRDLLFEYDLKKFVREERRDLNIYFPTNNSWIHFGGLDVSDKIRSSEWNYIWMEETTEFTYDDFMVLKTSLSAPEIPGYRNQIFMSFNPDDEYCWIKKNVIDGPEDCEEIPSNYRFNPFLSDDYVQELERTIEQDINYYRIFCLGEWGKLENIIYSNWDTIGSFPEDVDDVFYGLDFGYNVETALVKCGIKKDNKKDVFLEELIYQTKLTNKDLTEHLLHLIPNNHRRNARIYCDSAEPDRIQELKEAGFRVYGADKRSVKEGIDFVKTLKLHITKSSSNLIKEFRTYSWKTDRKDSKHILDEPVKGQDHLNDASRYGLYTHLRKLMGAPRIRAI